MTTRFGFLRFGFVMHPTTLMVTPALVVESHDCGNPDCPLAWSVVLSWIVFSVSVSW